MSPTTSPDAPTYPFQNRELGQDRYEDDDDDEDADDDDEERKRKEGYRLS